MLIQPKQVPLMGGFLSLIALAGIAPMIVRPLPAARAASDGEAMTIGTETEEAVLARYARLRDLLRAGRDRDALILWVTLDGQPLSVPQNSDEKGPIGSVAPASLFFQVGDQMIQRATARAQAGDTIDAGRWLGRCDELIYRVLTGPTVTPASGKVVRLLTRMTERASTRLGVRPKIESEL